MQNTRRGQNQPEYVRGLFANIAPRYDLVNTIISLGRDGSLRRYVAAKTGGLQRVLDVATGTAELAIELARRGHQVVGLDFCPEMMQRGQEKVAQQGLQDRVSFVLGDALTLPFPTNTFDCVTTSFTLRNISPLAGLFKEMFRVARPGASVLCLELTQPPSLAVASFYRFYLHQILPFLAWWLSGYKEAYRYLPSSTLGFPAAEELRLIMEKSGLHPTRYEFLNLGTVALHLGQKPGDN